VIDSGERKGFDCYIWIGSGQPESIQEDGRSVDVSNGSEVNVKATIASVSEIQFNAPLKVHVSGGATLGDVAAVRRIR
jgi:hypothetical protein